MLNYRRWNNSCVVLVWADEACGPVPCTDPSTGGWWKRHRSINCVHSDSRICVSRAAVIRAQREVEAVLFAGLLDCQTHAHAVTLAFARRVH